MNPTFCPYPECSLHEVDKCRLEAQWYQHNGFHHTKVVGVVPRYRCKACGRTFSDRTFSLDYWTKRTISYDEILRHVSASESVSRMAKDLHTLPNSIQNRIDRLARNCLALQERLEKDLAITEDLVADGFESYDRSQYFPNNLNILVGKESQYLYGMTHVTLRRKGRMTRAQKLKRFRLENEYRAPKGGIEKSFRELMKVIPKIWDEEVHPVLRLSTDEHRAYPRAIKAVKELQEAGERKIFLHQRYSSKAVRSLVNPLFSVNYYDRELRKDIMAYQRETKCHTRNVGNGMARVAVYQTWHNFMKPHRVTSRAIQEAVHGVYAGLREERISGELSKLYTERSFLSHLDLRMERLPIWLKTYRTPLKKKDDYLPKHTRM